MSTLAPTLQAFFTDRLQRQRQASPHTIAAYRDALRLLLLFAQQRAGKQPSQLELDDLDAPLIAAFLDHLERERGNSVRTRNARLAAIHSLFRFAALRHPEHAAVIQRVLVMPPKRFDRALITYLNEPEIDALLAAPDRGTWVGRRDHALLLLAIQTGLRASELIGLTRADLHLGTGAHLSCHGKGRKDRVTPLTHGTVATLTTWLKERAGDPDAPLFPTSRGRPLSRDALEHRLATHLPIATHACPSLARKKVTLHVLATPPRCGSCTPASTPPSSPSGSATKASKRPRSTCTPTSPSKSEHSPKPHRPTASPAATDPPTPCSPSSKRSDYAARSSPITAPDNASHDEVGITRKSA
jgi:site-specific recombinase XerD